MRMFASIDTKSLILGAIWLSQFCYLIGFIPQIIMNYRLQSLRGLSDLYIFSFFNGYIAELFYVFCLGLPVPYQIMVPVCTIGMSIIVFQRFYYGTQDSWSSKLLWIYVGNIVLAVGLIPIAIASPYKFGHAAGWLTAIIWCTYQIPQLVKIFFYRTVYGFSFGFATMIAMAAFIECGMALIIGLPYQTIISSARGVLVYLLFCVQFVLFRR